MDLDDIDDLRLQAYEIRATLVHKADDTSGPRINQFLPHLDKVIDHLDDWRVDLLDEDDDLDAEFHKEHGHGHPANRPD